MSKTIKIELTPTQAKVIWNLVDGQADAGACADGNTAKEARALQQITMKLIPHLELFKGVSLEDRR